MGLGLNPEERKQLGEYAVFRRQTAENTNLYIKAITGAQMSEAEADRLKLAVADAGQGIFDGQDPVSFKANLDNALKAAKLSKARLLHLRRSGQIGVDFKGFKTKKNPNGIEPPVSLNEMEGIMDNRAKELLQEAKMQNPDSDARAYAKQKLRQEFGI